MYYRGASAAIVVYDITNPDSFTGAKSWVKELQRRGDPNVVIALAGNKADMDSRRKVEFEEANAYAEENGILHLETSAKNANNVKALFVEIAKKLPKSTQQPEREQFPAFPNQQENRGCCWITRYILFEFIQAFEDFDHSSKNVLVALIFVQTQ